MVNEITPTKEYLTTSCSRALGFIKLGEIIDDTVERFDGTQSIQFVKEITIRGTGVYEIGVYNENGHYLYTFFGCEDDSMVLHRKVPRELVKVN